MLLDTQNTQNYKFPIPLQYLEENLKDEVEFPPSDKSRKVLQIDTIICKMFIYFKGVQPYWLLLVIAQY